MRYPELLEQRERENDLPPPLRERRRRWWRRHAEGRVKETVLAYRLLIEYLSAADNAAGTTSLGATTLARQFEVNKGSVNRSDGELIDLGLISIDRDPDPGLYPGAYRVVTVTGFAAIWVESDRNEEVSRDPNSKSVSYPDSDSNPDSASVSESPSSRTLIQKDNSSNAANVETSTPAQTPTTLPLATKVAPVAVADTEIGEGPKKPELTPEQQKVKAELSNCGNAFADDDCRLPHVTETWLRAMIEKAKGQKEPVRNMGAWLHRAAQERWEACKSVGANVADPRVVGQADALPDVIWVRARNALVARLESHFSTEPCGDRRVLVERIKSTPPRECREVRQMVTDAIAAGYFKRYFEDNEAS